MADNSISWVAWSVSDKDETCSMLLPSASSDGSWSDNDLKEWGITVRDAIKKI
jgi:endoglucanase